MTGRIEELPCATLEAFREQASALWLLARTRHIFDGQFCQADIPALPCAHRLASLCGGVYHRPRCAASRRGGGWHHQKVQKGFGLRTENSTKLTQNAKFCHARPQSPMPQCGNVSRCHHHAHTARVLCHRPAVAAFHWSQFRHSRAHLRVNVLAVYSFILRARLIAFQRNF